MVAAKCNGDVKDEEALKTVQVSVYCALTSAQTVQHMSLNSGAHTLECSVGFNTYRGVCAFVLWAFHGGNGPRIFMGVMVQESSWGLCSKNLHGDDVPRIFMGVMFQESS